MKNSIWRTLPLASAIMMIIEKRQGVILDDELLRLLIQDFGEVSNAEINRALMKLEIVGLIHVSNITRTKRRIELIKNGMIYMAVGED